MWSPVRCEKCDKAKSLNCPLLQEIADLRQQYLLGRWWRRWRRFFLAMESIDLLHNDENRKSDNEESDQGVEEEAVVHGHRPRRFRRIDGGKVSTLERQKEIGEIDASNEQSQRRHDDVVHQGIHDRGERRPD